MIQETRQHPRRGIELAVAAHVVVFIVGVSWAFGGNADWVRMPISAWGSLGILLSFAITAGLGSGGRANSSVLTWAWPVLALNALVAASCLTPGLRAMAFESGTLLVPVHVDWWVPSAARPDLALRALWLFDGIYFSCLNVALAVRSRRTIRLILAAAAANALALSIFGIVQKAFGSSGIYFGRVEVPHPQFFASFVYDNHWGAFTIIMIGACIGLVLRYAYGRRGEGFFNGPAFAGVVAAFVMAVSIPLSGSRACTMLLVALAGISLVHGAPRISRALRFSGATGAGLTLGMAAAALLAAGGAWLFAGDVIQARAQKTGEQLAAMWAAGGIGSRSVLYSDTIRMALARPLFGWGMGSYPVVFSMFNTQESKIDHLPVIYHDAHSDWLQSAAEIGLAGTALIGFAVALPLRKMRRHRVGPIPFLLLSACALVATYALVEFPFGNVAVVLAWWLCFLSAVQYSRLSGGADPAPPGE